MKRLWTFIASKKLEAHYASLKLALFEKTPLRAACYLLLTAAILVYWLCAPSGLISFVYNAF